MITEELKALRTGQRFSSTTQDLTFTATVALNGTLKHLVSITNPSNSGYRIIVDKILFFTSTASLPTAVNIYVNPTDITGTVVPNANLKVGGNVTDTTTVIKSTIGTAGFTGTPLPFQLPTGNGDDLLSVPFIIEPGNSVGIELNRTVTLALLATTKSGYLMWYWFREML